MLGQSISDPTGAETKRNGSRDGTSAGDDSV